MVIQTPPKPENSETPLTPDLLNRIVLVTADKGGTGKSMFSKTNTHFLIKYGIHALAYDADTRNPQLERHYGKVFPGGVQKLNLYDGTGVNTFLDTLEKEYKTVLVDLPAGIGEVIEILEKRLKLSEFATENNYRLTFATVLNRGRDCVNSLRSLIDVFGDRADYVAIKNLYYGSAEKFKRFDSSKTKQIILDLGGKIINLPDLDDDVADLLDDKSLTFEQATEKGKNSISTRTWVSAFLEESEKQFKLAAPYLGLGA